MAGERAELMELRRLDELEKKAGTIKGAPANDPLNAGPAGVAADMSESERRLAGVGRGMSKPFEAVGQLISHFTGHGAEADAKAQDNARLMGTLYKESARDTAKRPPVFTGLAGSLPGGKILNDLAKVPAGTLEGATGATGAALAPVARVMQGPGALARLTNMGLTGGALGAAEPVTSGKDFASEKGKQMSLGAIGAMTVSQAVQALSKSPGLVKNIAQRFGLLKQPIAPSKPVGVGAEQVTAELQKQRDVSAGRAEPRTEGASAYERSKVDFEERMKPIKDAALNDQTPVDASPVVQQIEKLKAQNSAPGRKALDEVLKEIRHFAKQALPAQGTRMSVQDLKALQARGDTLSVKGADEVRQFINLKMNQTGDKALDANTKRVLASVQSNLVARSPKAHRDWIAAESKGRQELDALKPDVGATGKLTQSERGVAPLAGADAQRAMNDVLGGKTSARDLKQLVEATKHSTGASTALRSSYKDWLVQRNSVGEIKAGQMLDRWTESRDAVRDSGLFDKAHFDNVDKLMDTLREGYKSSKAYTQAGNMLGWFMSGYRGAYLGRTVGGKLAENVERDVESRVVDLILKNPQAAAILVKPATQANIDKASELLGKIGGQRQGKQNRIAAPRALGMTPPGVPSARVEPPLPLPGGIRG